MKVKTYVLGVAAVSMMTSFATKDARFVEGLNPGDLAPRIESLGGERGFGFQNHEGRYTLLNFWAAYDAKSRVDNVRLWNEVKKNGSGKVAMYSVSLDECESVFSETVKADGLSKTRQILAGNGEKTGLFKKFELGKGFRSYLIDANGVIVARDLAPEDLAEILKGA